MQLRMLSLVAALSMLAACSHKQQQVNDQVCNALPVVHVNYETVHPMMQKLAAPGYL